MKQHPRLRKAAKWGGLALAGVSLLAWGWSLFFLTGWITRDGSIWALRRGQVSLTWRSASNVVWGIHGAPIAPGAVLSRTRYAPTDWGFGWSTGPGERVAAAPLWASVAAGLLVGVPAWVLDRRARRRVLAGHCLKCGYDRSTLAAGSPCPECGAGGRV